MSREQKGSCEIACVPSMHSHFASSPRYQIAADSVSIGNVHLMIPLIALQLASMHGNAEIFSKLRPPRLPLVLPAVYLFHLLWSSPILIGGSKYPWPVG